MLFKNDVTKMTLEELWKVRSMTIRNLTKIEKEIANRLQPPSEKASTKVEEKK